MTKPRVALVVAIAEDNVIGKGGTLPWRVPEDMKWFREITMGKPCIMGRKTWESLPKRPLPGRRNIVVTRDQRYRADGAEVADSVAQAIEIAARDGAEEIAVIGGAQIYADALALTDRIYLTRVHAAVAGDVYFPEIDFSAWRSVQRAPLETSSTGVAFEIVQLDRM